MADNGETFTLDIAAFVQKAKGNVEKVVRRTSIDLLTNVVMRTPVGNPELWAVNRVAVNYNTQVTEHNANLRNDPANMTKAGRLRPGKKLHDGMDIVKPAGYVGGRLRGNWFVSIGQPVEITTDKTDANGSETIKDGKSIINGADVTKDIYMTNSLPYAIPIEYGHSKNQAPEGMVRVTIAEFNQYVAANAASVSDASAQS